MQNLKFLSLLIFLVSCSSSEAPGSLTNETIQISGKVKTKKTEPVADKVTEEDLCVCFRIYAPVCGNNGKTYGNKCEAECKKVKYKEGACP